MNTITKIAYSNNKKNRTRSLLIMAVIFLSTALLAIIATFAYGMLKTNKVNAPIKYGSFDGVCTKVTSTQLKEMRRRAEYAQIGVVASAGKIGSKANASFLMADAHAREMANLTADLVSGSFPEAEREIAASREFLEAAGWGGAEIGDTVSLPYRKDKRHRFAEKQFVISGILRQKEAVPGGEIIYSVFASQAFYEKMYAPKERSFQVYFQMADGVLVDAGQAEEAIQEVAQKCGIDKKQALANKIYLLMMLDPGLETIGICVCIALVVVFFTVAIIYHIFQVGIVQNIQEYGKIRALGADKKQMRRLINWEGMYLAAFSIPSGVAVGYLIAWGCFGMLMRMGNERVGEGMVIVNVFSLPLLLLSAATAFFTVWLALRKPMKIVASISPVDAVRYLESAGGKTPGIRTGKKNVTVASLATANLAAEKKRTVYTVLTMGLSCVLFVVLANVAGNMDTEYEARQAVEYGQFKIELDYTFGEEAYPENNLDSILKHNPLNQQLIDSVARIPGVTQVRTMDILMVQTDGRQEDVLVYGQEDFEREKGNGIGKLDYQDSLNEDIIYYGWSHFMEEDGYVLGDKVSMQLSDGTDTRTVEATLKGSFGVSNAMWVMTEDMYRRLGFPGVSAGCLWVNCAKEDVADVQRALEGLLNGVEHLQLTAYESQVKQAEFSIRVLQGGCYLFLAVLGFIGFLNLANTMIMNIITKKQEYGILQAVGMTDRQLNRSLQLQGLVLSAGTVLVAVIVGLPLGYGLFCYCKANAYFGMNVYHVPVLEVVCMAALVMLLQIGLSFILSRNMKKESLVERIRSFHS